MTDPRKTNSVISMPEEEIARTSSLFSMTQAKARDQMANTLLEYRAYCKRKETGFQAYLIELALLEVMEVRKGQQREADDNPG